jgi:hypothetical protein
MILASVNLNWSIDNAYPIPAPEISRLAIFVESVSGDDMTIHHSFAKPPMES